MLTESIVVLDFETTGLSPDQGDRAIEIGAVKLLHGEVIDTYQALMNPGKRVSSFIEQYTGISNQMLVDAPPCEAVMESFAGFIGDSNLLAHNASFDSRFLAAEFARINRNIPGRFLCSLLLSRRLYQAAPNHKLATLIKYKNISAKGQYHRALFDAEMTAKLWLVMLEDIRTTYDIEEIPSELLFRLLKVPKSQVEKLLSQYAAQLN